MREGSTYIKKTVLLLIALAMLTSLAACTLFENVQQRPNTGNEQKGTDILNVLDEDTKAFFEQFDENSPQYMLVNYDQHYPVAIIIDQSLMRDMKAAICDIRIKSKTNIASTDGYHSVYFITPDGERFGIRFENSVLCVGENRYVIDNAQNFWSVFKTVAEEYWDMAQENATKLESAPVTYNGDLSKKISCEVLSVNAQKIEDSVWLDVNAPLAFTNIGDSAITKVALRTQFLDYDGYIIDDQEIEADFSDEQILPGDTKEYRINKQIYDFSKGPSIGGVMGVLVSVENLS